METATGPKTVQCVVVTPERTVLDAAVDFVALPMFDGELGVLPGRTPLIGRLGPGELRTKKGGEVHRYYVDGGFAQVRANVVTVLTPRALKAEEIPAQPAPVAPNANPDARLKAQQKVRIQQRIVRHERGETVAH